MPLDELKHASPALKNKGTPKSPQTQNKLKANRLLIQGDRHYQYDEYGNVIRELRGKRQHTEHQFKWDGQHRLIEFKKIRHYWDEYDKDFHQTVETVHSYEYDAFGRRISKTDMQTGDKTLFFWLGDKLITECHADDADFSVEAIRNEHTKAQNYRCLSYIYEPSSTGFRPMAQLVGRGRGGQIYYYLNDQLGTPQELMTANGDIVWSGVYKSYGELAIEYRTVPQNLRFQGQYFDEESGLHYNRYRYYDPYTARYISQDPIGLAGGENAYSYVPNPLAWIDPLGLSDECPGTKGGKGTNASYDINVNELKFTQTVENHLNDLNKAGDRVRPYGDSKALIQEIINSKKPVIDPRGVPGALRWDIEGTMNGSKGIYELVINPKTNTVLHFLFKSKK